MCSVARMVIGVSLSSMTMRRSVVGRWIIAVVRGSVGMVMYAMAVVIVVKVDFFWRPAIMIPRWIPRVGWIVYTVTNPRRWLIREFWPC